MNKKKLIDELLISIFNLVNEAKEANEHINQTTLKSQTSTHTEIKPPVEIDKPAGEKYSNQKSEPGVEIIKNNNDFSKTNWQNINFSKNNIITSKSNDFLNRSNSNNEIIKKRFHLLLNAWMDKNLKKLIEIEFSNHIKSKNN